jgi:predicted dithiol-disulfide oxidoreductase (DUF899 family)
VTEHRVVGHEEWLEARKEVLAREKEFTRARDQLTRQVRTLPWERVEKEYVFDTPEGARTLADLFERRSQLVVYHFMFPPEDDEGCPSCSFWADSFDANVIHMKARDITFVAVSRAPLEKLEAYRRRLGWGFTWVSSGRSDFNYDYRASFRPEEQGEQVYNYGTLPPGRADREGMSVFYRVEDGTVFHTYSSYSRGIDILNAAYNYIDLVPKGRDEHGRSQSWVRRRDSYGDENGPEPVGYDASARAA